MNRALKLKFGSFEIRGLNSNLKSEFHACSEFS